jgi:hypothetical protein
MKPVRLHLSWLGGMASAGQGSAICCTPRGAAVRSRCKLSPTEVDLAERLYAAGWLLREIGVELAFSRDAVRRALLQRGVVMRSGYGSANRSKRAERQCRDWQSPREPTASRRLTDP